RARLYVVESKRRKRAQAAIQYTPSIGEIVNEQIQRPGVVFDSCLQIGLGIGRQRLPLRSAGKYVLPGADVAECAAQKAGRPPPKRKVLLQGQAAGEAAAIGQPVSGHS